MVKKINILLDEVEHAQMSEIKGSETWADVLRRGFKAKLVKQ